MDRDYPALRAPGYGPGASGKLLRGGRVALFPDGLDKMSEDARTRRGGRIVRLSRGSRRRHGLHRRGALAQRAAQPPGRSPRRAPGYRTAVCSHSSLATAKLCVISGVIALRRTCHTVIRHRDIPSARQLPA